MFCRSCSLLSNPHEAAKKRLEALKAKKVAASDSSTPVTPPPVRGVATPSPPQTPAPGSALAPETTRKSKSQAHMVQFHCLMLYKKKNLKIYHPIYKHHFEGAYLGYLKDKRV